MKKILLSTLFLPLFIWSSYAAIDTISVANFGFSPSSLSIDPGDTVRFVWVSGTHPVASDTIGDWTTVTLDGTTNTEFDVVLTIPGAYPYYCQVHGGAGGIGMSGVITLNSVGSAPSITSEPSSDTITEGGNASLAVIATDATGYQWQENTGSGFANITNGGIYTGATTATLSLTAVPLSNNGFTYRCIVSGSVSPNDTSATATLTVNAAPVASTTTVIMVEDFAFDPDSIHIDLGDTVRFKWVSGVHPTASPEGSWATFQMTATDTLFDLVLTSEGTYIFYCMNHGQSNGSGMAGKIIVGNPSAIGKLQSNTFMVYPNPANDNISIIHNYPQVEKVEIYNTIGERVLSFSSQNMNTMSVSSLETGIYFVKALSGNKVLHTSRIIKK